MWHLTKVKSVLLTCLDQRQKVAQVFDLDSLESLLKSPYQAERSSRTHTVRYVRGSHFGSCQPGSIHQPFLSMSDKGKSGHCLHILDRSQIPRRFQFARSGRQARSSGYAEQLRDTRLNHLVQNAPKFRRVFGSYNQFGLFSNQIQNKLPSLVAK